MIAIVADRYEDAAEYMEQIVALAATWDPGSHRIPPPSTEWIVVLRPEDIRLGSVLTGAVFLGGGVSVREAVAGALSESEYPQAVQN